MPKLASHRLILWVRACTASTCQADSHDQTLSQHPMFLTCLRKSLTEAPVCIALPNRLSMVRTVFQASALEHLCLRRCGSETTHLSGHRTIQSNVHNPERVCVKIAVLWRGVIYHSNLNVIVQGRRRRRGWGWGAHASPCLKLDASVRWLLLPTKVKLGQLGILSNILLQHCRRRANLCGQSKAPSPWYTHNQSRRPCGGNAWWRARAQ